MDMCTVRVERTHNTMHTHTLLSNIQLNPELNFLFRKTADELVISLAAMKTLTIWQRIIFGCLSSSNIAGLVDGLVMFYYNDQKGVSTEYLGIINLIIAIITAYWVGKFNFYYVGSE